MGRKKKFIDKKNSVTFQLLARDSSDPNYNDTPGGDRIFIRVDNNPLSVDRFFDANHDENPDSVFADAPDDEDDEERRDFGGGSSGGGAYAAESGALSEQIRKEILELGFPDDGYNYLHHMREIKNSGGGSYFYTNPKAVSVHVPNDVKAYDASRVRVPEVKTDDTNDNSIYSVAAKTVGARLQKVLDPEVAALLDDDSDLSRFGSDVEDLEEDFIVRANFPEDQSDLVVDESLDLIGESSDRVSLGNRETAVQNGSIEKEAELVYDFASEKPRTRRMLDEKFDLLESQEYGTDDEDDEYGGYIAEEEDYLANKLNNVLNDSAKLEMDCKYEVPEDLSVVRRCVEYAEKYENEDEDVEAILVEESSDESEQWDCETIVTTYSNLDNHPAKIDAPGAARKKKIAETFSGALNGSSHVIALRGKEKLPVDFLPRGRKSDAEKVKDVSGLKTEPVKRKQHGQESKEEKKERKAAVKEERREARRLKKEVKVLYRDEAYHAQKVAATSGPSSIHLS
ncbi:hypothetical protein M5689_016226 [Euphorbia peplus]|nr:hypothetical protein M5689_016226 [Euphorbia peplus]